MDGETPCNGVARDGGPRGSSGREHGGARNGARGELGTRGHGGARDGGHGSPDGGAWELRTGGTG